MNELRIALALAGNNISVALHGPAVPGNLRIIQRPLLELDAGVLEELRRGEIKEPGFKQLVQQLNDWLLDQEVRQILGHSIPNNGGRLRIVFTVTDEVRAYMAGLPFELLWHDTPANPLVLRKDIQSLIYKLEKSPTAASSPAATNWPLKILIVRAKPPDLGDVPPVNGIRQHILNLGAHFGPDMVQVDVISSEPGIDKPATWTGLRNHLRKTSDYSLMVYLGHGEIVPAQIGGEPVGQVFMESEDGGGHQPISSPQLAILFRKHPIPVILLAGCLTAADPGAATRQRGGEQGVAQALVNSSEAGVQVAIGMRTELRTDAAVRFLEAFFTSFLDAKHGGDIDAAVRAGREELFLDGPFPPSWASPVVFRAIEREPLLEFVSQPVSFQVSKEMDKWIHVRAKLWKHLPDQLAAGGNSEALQGVKAAIKEIEELLCAEGAKIGPLLMPEHAIVQPGKDVTFAVDLDGNMSVRTLKGNILIGNNAAVITGITLAQSARTAGLNLIPDPGGNANVFHIVSASAGPIRLPEGKFLEVSITGAADAAPGLYPITVGVETISPQAKYWPGDNVLIVTES